MEPKTLAAPARYPEIDVARGFALFLVVFTHVVMTHSTMFNWVISFHMQAFFFLSGMTLRPERFSTFPSFFANKFRKRIIPYLVISAIAFVICMIRPYYRQGILESGWEYMAKWFFYYGQPKNLYIGQIWFLVALFMAEILFYIWHRIFSKTHPLVQFYSLAAIALFGIKINAVNALIPAMGRLPLKMDTALVAAIFLIAGYYTQKHDILRKLEPYALFLIPVLIFLNYYFGPFAYGYTNICDCVYSPAAYYYTASFCGTFAMLLVALKLKNWKFWQYCGQNPLPMFASQTFFIYLVVEVIYLVSGTWFDPMHNITSNKTALAITAVAFALMVCFSWPFHLWKKRKS